MNHFLTCFPPECRRAVQEGQPDPLVRCSAWTLRLWSPGETIIVQALFAPLSRNDSPGNPGPCH
jgi:hypothetical protein